MATLSDFMPFVMPYAPGCSFPLAELHLRAICIDFCTAAPIAQAAVDPVSVLAGQTSYDIDTPAGADVSRIIEAAYLGRELTILPASESGAAPSGLHGAAQALRLTPNNTFALDAVPADSAAGAITLVVAVKPKRNASVVPDVLLEYAYEIGAGVVGRLMLIPGNPFSNPRAAATYTDIYTTARTAARIRAEQSSGGAASRVRPRRFQ